MKKEISITDAITAISLGVSKLRCGMLKRRKVIARVLPDSKPFTVTGRKAWTLAELVRVQQKACTTINKPAPRRAEYLHSLRRNQGLVIQACDEAHKGQFAGTHGRYVLMSKIEISNASRWWDIAAFQFKFQLLKFILAWIINEVFGVLIEFL